MSTHHSDALAHEGHQSAPAHPTAFFDRAQTILDALGTSPIASNAYTTAWAARLRKDGEPLFPAARQWLLDQQLPDGSWGGVIKMPYDRTISTLAAAVALACDSGPGDPRAQQAVDDGCRYLREHGGEWRHHYAETCAFETIVPQLLSEARALGLQVPYQEFTDLEEARAAKLRLIPLERLVSEPTSLLFSLEGIPQLPDIAPQLTHFLSQNGTLGNSVASTIAYYSATGNPQSLRFLESVQAEDGGFPEFHPYEIMEKLWVLHHLHRARLLRDPSQYTAWLREVLGETGLVAFSSSFSTPDSDDSSMSLVLLHEFAPTYDSSRQLHGLLSFENLTNFADFPYARQTSLAPNARVLQALLKQPDRYRPQIDKALQYVLGEQHDDGKWCDYWNVSPYYGTAHVAFSLTTPGLSRSIIAEPLNKAYQWLIRSQHRSGVWGFGDGTPEETAYAVLALDAMADAGMPVDHRVWNDAAVYLRERLDDPSYPLLWIAKALYGPNLIVRSGLLAGYAIALARAGGKCS
ncbi:MULTISPECIES: prenyltransferase/squalene oxidase repeat-containing protein [Streptomyces]|uniref:prenyltransferase/squalene oxidase repeat-containing protein n=1 Tax=Streptomyces TaxID=1883 RepID=UPI000E687E38|nr:MULTISPECIES: prenyltransferase/squalene oxidase repeat-containing protein [Streptomyces]MDX3064373.1 prenyltransferase/squalene oxidase repeat-containing protein [Streptomyces sp. ND04-05B]MDX3519657.1 prenyltransferase/squalene oxidase repeat-containing protein [Streptomyces scabiei]